jgi:curved DNA-binding protein CbpA
MKNYYEILEVSYTASPDEIKKAFRLKAIKYHPDKHFGDTFFAEKFIEVREAYDTLSDPNKKAEYDIQYKATFIKEEPEKEQTYQEEKRKEKEREEKFRYDPYKQFYSSYDREQQETPQYPPQQTPWGEMINEILDFFILPKRIGKIIGGYSTLVKGTKAISPFQLFITVVKNSWIGISITFGIVFLLYCNWTFNLHQDGTLSRALIFFFVIVGIILGFKLYVNSNATKFEHSCYFIGINGFAFYKCQGSKENITEKNEINFNDVTDMVSRFEVRKRNFQYVNTAYQFLWMNTKNKKINFEGNGLHYDKDDNPNKYAYPEYWLNKEAEKYWTVYLLDNMEKSLQENGHLEFNIYSFDKNLFQPYIRVGIGYITFLKGEESFTYKFNEIKKMYTKGADLFIEHVNYEKKLFFFKSGNQDSIPLRMLCNRQFFYKSMELLLGYKIA